MMREKGVFAVFPGASSARAAARRLASRLEGSTTRDLEGGESVVELRRGDRRVAITCPPSTAYLVEIYDGETSAGAGHTIEDGEAIAVATSWLDGAAFDVLMSFMRGAIGE